MLWRLHYVSRLFLCHLLLHSFRCEEQKQQRSDILLALERAALFLEEESQDINVDAILGFAVLQAYLNKTLAKWETKPGLEPDSKRVALLEKKLSAGMEEARSALELENPDSYREWAQVLRPSFWKVPEHFERLDYAVAFTPTNGSCLDLKESDVCLSFLLGSWKDDGEPCLVPRKCSRLMTQTHCSDYALSHQLFNFLFAEMKGCRNPLFLNARFYRNVLCRLMMQENLHPQKNALLNAPGDLFTENIMFCGLAGFSNFYKPEWLDRILSWQLPEKGCFWMYEDPPPNVEDPVHKPQRMKRTEKFNKGGCSSHNTAVAVAAIGGFLYYGF